jgi:large subunit ribosomal protein L25
MELAHLKCESRVVAGSRAAARLRKSGRIPGIMYGHGEDTVPIAVPQHELELLLHHGAHLLELDLNGQKRPVLIKEVQYDHLGTTPVHVDLARVSLDERVRVTVPIELRGEAKGIKEGGVLDQTIADLEIECLVTQIPENVRVSVENLAIGDALHVSDIVLPEGVVALQAADLVVCNVRMPIEAKPAEAAPAEEAAAAEPEVIGRKEKEPEAEAEE